MRVLAIYYDLAEMDVPRCVQFDVSREQGIWSVVHLLASGQVAEVRFVGETLSSVRLVRTLVRAGKYKRPSGHLKSLLWVPGDESYPLRDPFIFIRPEAEPAAFV